jgi:para-nitrobenzyl esterase
MAVLSFSACNAPEKNNDMEDTLPVGQIRTENGLIEGRYDTKLGLEYYFGIPYAKPPVGALRWKAPQPLDNWEGIKETKKFANRPMQLKLWDDLAYRSDTISEDALYLNVWAPTQKETGNLPVLVYIHGGGLMAGDGSELRYDGESMAKKGMVVVTINYRLNVFGLLAHPELSAESPNQASGNYALLDQAAALSWVHRNIAAFGGDPQKVTIAGESAGSMSVSAHMASPLTRDLIAGAIGESGAVINPTAPPVPLAEAEATGVEFMEKIGKSSLAEMRAMSTEELWKAYNDAKFGRFPLVLDGYYFENNVSETFKAGKQAKVPLLVGWNSAEMNGMAFMQGKKYGEAAYIKQVKETFPDHHKAILNVYPGRSAKQVELSATALASDTWIVYSTWKWSELQREYSDQPVYRYLYNKLRPPLVRDKDKPQPKAVGAPHACEIEYCLGNLHLLDHYWAWTEEDYTVSKVMQDYFANFILTGNPNGGQLPNWPDASNVEGDAPVMIINVDSKSEVAANENRYKVLDKIYDK